MKQSVESLLDWARSLGRSGAWFLVTVGVLAVSGLALWVALTALTLDRPPNDHSQAATLTTLLMPRLWSASFQIA